MRMVPPVGAASTNSRCPAKARNAMSPENRALPSTHPSRTPNIIGRGSRPCCNSAVPLSTAVAWNSSIYAALSSPAPGAVCAATAARMIPLAPIRPASTIIVRSHGLLSLMRPKRAMTTVQQIKRRAGRARSALSTSPKQAEGYHIPSWRNGCWNRGQSTKIRNQDRLVEVRFGSFHTAWVKNPNPSSAAARRLWPAADTPAALAWAALVESRMGAVAWAMRQRSVSHPRSSNRTCGFPASGSPTGFVVRHTEQLLTASVICAGFALLENRFPPHRE